LLRRTHSCRSAGRRARRRASSVSVFASSVFPTPVGPRTGAPRALPPERACAPSCHDRALSMSTSSRPRGAGPSRAPRWATTRPAPCVAGSPSSTGCRARDLVAAHGVVVADSQLLAGGELRDVGNAVSDMPAVPSVNRLTTPLRGRPSRLAELANRGRAGAAASRVS
jgi:hypothetical protein